MYLLLKHPSIANQHAQRPPFWILLHTEFQPIRHWLLTTWGLAKNTIIIRQIDFVTNFCLHILIEGSSQTFLVSSQFFQFFAEMPYISAVRHLSKIWSSYFYTTWPPLTLETIKFFRLKRSFTSAVRSTVNLQCKCLIL